VAVRFLGYVRGDELARLYHGSRLFVFPSVQENFPMVLLEAMSAGCAVVTTRAPGCVEVVGDAAVLTTPGDVAELAAALERLLADPAAVERLGAAARRRAARFCWRHVAAGFHEVFARHALVPEARRARGPRRA
jgi:glycosyltransferase involved in cell wall biosynthesis